MILLSVSQSLTENISEIDMEKASIFANEQIVQVSVADAQQIADD